MVKYGIDAGGMMEFKKVPNPEQQEIFFRKFNNRMHHKRMGEGGAMAPPSPIFMAISFNILKILPDYPIITSRVR
jgi:hypothetical protein